MFHVHVLFWWPQKYGVSAGPQHDEEIREKMAIVSTEQWMIACRIRYCGVDELILRVVERSLVTKFRNLKLKSRRK